MANEISKNEKLTIKAIKVAIANVLEDVEKNLKGSRSEIKKNKLLLKRFSLELINKVVNNFDELDGVAKVLKEVSLSIDTFADALKSGKGEDVVNYLITQGKTTEFGADIKTETLSKIAKNKKLSSQDEQKIEEKKRGKVQRVNSMEIAEIQKEKLRIIEEKKKQTEEMPKRRSKKEDQFKDAEK